MSASPAEVLESAKTLYEDKEEDYGASWRLTGEILSEIIKTQGKEEITIPAEPEYLIAFGLYTRRLDKLVRSFNGTFIADEMNVDESVTETVKDQAPYAAMQTTIAQEMQAEQEKEEEEMGNCEEKYCSKCGKKAIEKVPLEECENCFECYCTCGYAWRSE
jgi:hypothetical protein